MGDQMDAGFDGYHGDHSPRKPKIEVERIDTPNNDSGYVINHFIARFEGPGRIEVTNSVDGHMIAHAYSGFETDPEQEVDIAFDSTVM